ncbi:MAG: Do family serine endopeptidase [Bacteroidota bacterium]
MNKKQFFLSIVVATLLGIGITLGSDRLLTTQHKQATVLYEPSTPKPSIQLTSLPTISSHIIEEAPNLIQAAQIATPAVVHIKATYEAKVMRSPNMTTPLDQLFKDFFGEGFDATPREYKSQPQHATGSGVIISPEGYIVTNNHVIDEADQIEVTLDDNRKYSAQLIGQDPNTDLALLKIKEKELPYLQFGNSDTLQVGEWVLAVGNPFNLTSTVTKGIVSAKARTIEIPQNKNQMRIEAFIQTDAAVNRGNSGGALVNLKGELVGINTAIASNTGNFTGYSFAIPASIVQKITDDLKKYGTVQRAMLGISIRDVDADLAEKEGLKKLNGVYIAEISKSGAAAEAGIQAGDVIVAINGNKVKTTSQLQEQIARYKPNDKVRVTFYRKDQEKTVTVTLKGIEEKISIVRKKDAIELGGATFENIDQATKKRLNISGGVRIRALKAGPWKMSGLQQGFIITAIDKEQVEHLDKLFNILNRKTGGALIECYDKRGQKAYLAVDLDNQ